MALYARIGRSERAIVTATASGVQYKFEPAVQFNYAYIP